MSDYAKLLSAECDNHTYSQGHDCTEEEQSSNGIVLEVGDAARQKQSGH